MRRLIRTSRALGWLAVCLGATVATAADPPPAPTGTPRAPVIGTHQIDRYAAIERVQAALKADPRSLSDWILLGELARTAVIPVPRLA